MHTQSIMLTSEKRTHREATGYIKKKVRFFIHTRVRPIPAHEDRRGTWAIDAARFRQRIAHIATIIDPVLNKRHV